MSRYVETGVENGRRWYFETLESADGCRFRVNEVCCNADERPMVADFPDSEYCKTCKHFVGETKWDIGHYSKGVKTYE